MKQISITLALFFCIVAVANNQIISAGVNAPELVLSEVSQGPALKDITLKKLKGKVVILEFWATWCAPCISAFSHINQLVEKCKDKNVIFISVNVDERKDANEKIKSILARNPLNTWVVKDVPALTTRNLYNAEVLPRTVIIDGNGVIKDITVPEMLTEDMLLKIAAETASLALPGDDGSQAQQQPGVSSDLKEKRNLSDTLLSVTISENKNYGGTIVFNNGISIGVIGGSATQLVEWLYDDVPGLTVLGADSLPAKRWNVKINCTPKISTEIKKNLRNSILSITGLTISQSQKEMEVYVLKCPKGPQAGKNAELKKVFEEGKGHSSSSGKGYITVSNKSMPDIITFLKRAQGFTPILNETGLEGKYDFIVQNFKEEDIVSFSEVIKEAGLELIKAKRKINLISVDSLKQ